MSDLVSRVLAAIETKEREAPFIHNEGCDSLPPPEGYDGPFPCDCGIPAAVLRRCEAYRWAINRYNMLHERQRRFDESTAVGERRIVHARITEAEGMLECIAHGLGISVEEETTHEGA